VNETEELIRLMGSACLAMMGEAPAFEFALRRNCGLCLTGEDVADFNMLWIGPNPDGEAFLAEAMARVKARGLPLLALFSPEVAEALAPAAERLGLTAAGTAPLMVLRANGTTASGARRKIVRVLGKELVGVAGDLSSAAFSLPRDAIARSLDVGITETAGVETWIAYGDESLGYGGPMSAVTVSPAGTTAGIWTMSTPPQHQRKGMGRALLTQVIDDYQGRGVERFFLIATEAGQPLYESIGFETVALFSAWVLGHSTQMHG
jgi:ribosomal protein S18 acetylase RimI-like enzyme